MIVLGEGEPARIQEIYVRDENNICLLTFRFTILLTNRLLNGKPAD